MDRLGVRMASKKTGADAVAVVEQELLAAEQDVVHGLDAEHAAVVLVADLVLPAPEAPAAPDALLLPEPADRE